MRKTSPKNKTLRSKAVYVARHRRRMKRGGLRRLEVAVRPRDIPAVKAFVARLQSGKLDGDIALINANMPKARTGAEFVEMLKKLTPFGDEVRFERDNLERPFFSFE